MSRHTPDEDQDLMEQQEATDRSKTSDIYNEELARRAVGGLFDEDDPDDYDVPASDDARYVTGFDTLVEKPRIRVAYDKPARKSDPNPKDLPEPADDYDYDNDSDLEDSNYTRRKRDRSKESAPPPRPAVKVNVASASGGSRGTRSSARSRPVVTSRADEYDDYDEEDFDSFRQRPKGSRPSAPPQRRAEGRTRPHRAPEREAYAEYDDAESASPVRWVAAGLSFIFLVILAFLVFRITVLSGELNDARAQLASIPSNESEITDMRLTIEAQDKQLIEKDNEIDRLMAELSGLGPSEVQTAPNDTTPGTGQTDDAPPDTSTQATNANTQTLPTNYKVVSGDNLTKISIKFYGNSNPSNIQKIKDANGMTNDNLTVGQDLKIPE